MKDFIHVRENGDNIFYQYEKKNKPKEVDSTFL